MAKTHKYKSCKCASDFDEQRLVCTGCGTSKLSVPKLKESNASEEANLIESLPFLTDAQNAERARIEQRIAGNKKVLLSGRKMSQESLVEAYVGLGMSEEQAKICVGSEMILESALDKEVHSKLDEAGFRRRVYDVGRLMGMDEATALTFSQHPSHRNTRDFQDFVFDDLIA